MPHASFVHLHVRSHYSMLAGASSVADLVERAARQGQSHLALTDRNGVWGNVVFQKACAAAGITPVHGVELSAENEAGKRGPGEAGSTTTGEAGGTTAGEAKGTFRVPSGPLRGAQRRAVLLARNEEGWAALCRAVSLRQLRPDFELGQTVRQLLVEHPHDLFVLSDDVDLLRSWAPLVTRRTAGAGGNRTPRGESSLSPLHVLLAWQECIPHPERLAGPRSPLEAVEIWRHAPRVPNRRRLRHLDQLARSLHLPTVASGEVWFAEPDGLLTQRVLSAIRTRSTLAGVAAADLAPEGAWLRPPEEMVTLFDEFPQAVAATADIAEACAFEMELGKWSYPQFPLPAGETTESHLWKIAFDGLARRFQPIPPRAMERLQEEMQVVTRLGFAEYLLVVWDIARFAHEEGIPVVGRGSAANSLLCYVLGITNIDPLAHDLFFQRFLNPERVNPPDIDLDFCWRRRDKVLRYVYERYGPDRVAMIGSIARFAARSGVREVARTLGLSDREITPVTDHLPHRSLQDLASWQERIPEARELPLHEEPWRSILEVGLSLEGFPRHMGTHAGGIVIGRTPLTDRFPLQWSRKGFIISQLDMYSMEDIGLVKIDLLAQRGLSVVADTVEAVHRHTGRRIDFQQDYSDDPATRRAMGRGETMGCFYVESPGMRALLRKLQADTFPLVVAASSLIRPGPSDSGMMRRYVQAHLGLEPPQRLHPDLAFLDETYGVMVYQEDVMRVAHIIGGLSLGEADLMRRAMSFKGTTDQFLSLKKKFLNGARRRGVDDAVATEIWRQMESFAGYAFCKAHSAAYAVVSFQAVYLKVHWPAEFMAAVLSNQGGYYHASAYLEEARRLGLKILLPDINHSEIVFTGRDRELRMGLMQVKGLSTATMQAIVRERESRGFFVSLSDVLHRVREASENEIDALIRVGAMDGFELSRPELLWKHKILRRQQRHHRAPAAHPVARAGGLASLFPESEMGTSQDASIVPRIPDWSARQRLRLEQEGLDLSASLHPMGMLRAHLDGRGVLPARELVHHVGRRVRVAGILIAAKSTTVQRSGEPMKFLSLEDETDLIEVTLFPRVYRRWGHVLLTRGPYLVTGRVEDDHGSLTLTAEKVELLQ